MLAGLAKAGELNLLLNASSVCSEGEQSLAAGIKPPVVFFPLQIARQKKGSAFADPFGIQYGIKTLRQVQILLANRHPE